MSNIFAFSTYEAAQDGAEKRSLTDPDSPFLRERQGLTLGYTVAMAVSEDHMIVEQRVTQETTENASLLPLIEAVARRCGRDAAKGQRRLGVVLAGEPAGLGSARHRGLRG